jgi:TRAP-type uncharacterized transport system substrate-binding protein
MTTWTVMIVCVALLMTVGTGVSQTRDITLGCGGATGAYTLQICPALQKHLAEKGFTDVKLFPSEGSGANLTDIAHGNRTAALVQMDVFVKALADNPPYQTFLPLGEIVPEALLLVIRQPGKGGRITDWSTLTQQYPTGMQPEKFKVAVAGSEQSGSYITMQTIFQAIPTLAQNTTLSSLTVSPEAAYNYLNSGVLDAVAFVMMPDSENPRIASVLKSDTWMFLDINEPRLETILFNRKPVYVLAELAKFGPKGKALKTPVTYATLLVDPSKTDDAVVRALNEAATNPELLTKESLVGRWRQWLQGVLKGIKKSS